ncbi:MAG: hypothetical protein AAFQ82_24290, partial [Myxococcota bacterium]
QCNALEADERTLALSPEGDLWTARADGNALVLRVFHPDGTVDTRTEMLGLPAAARAKSSQELDLVVDGSLWQLDDSGRTLLTLPASAAQTEFCGDLTDRGLLLSGIELYEARDLNWWRSDLADQSGGAFEILDLGGECLGTDNFTWLTGTDGSVWRLSASRAEQVRLFENRTSAAINDLGIAVFAEDSLWRRTSEETWIRNPIEGFSAPTVLAGANEDLWFYTDAQLVRLNGTTAEVTAWADTPTAMTAYDGGLWIESSSEVCHVSGRHSIRVSGILPYQRVTDAALAFTLNAPEDTTVTASVDGETLNAGFESGAWIVSGELPHIGWNSIELNVGSETRTLSVKLLPANVVSYETDIAPIYAAHCADCHVEGGESVDLSTYDDWVRYSNAIRSRSVESSNMPPLAQRSAEWDDEEVQLISEWLEGGMRP